MINACQFAGQSLAASRGAWPGQIGGPTAESLLSSYIEFPEHVADSMTPAQVTDMQYISQAQRFAQRSPTMSVPERQGKAAKRADLFGLHSGPSCLFPRHRPGNRRHQVLSRTRQLELSLCLQLQARRRCTGRPCQGCREPGQLLYHREAALPASAGSCSVRRALRPWPWSTSSLQGRAMKRCDLFLLSCLPLHASWPSKSLPWQWMIHIPLCLLLSQRGASRCCCSLQYPKDLPHSCSGGLFASSWQASFH